jgi:predicted Na+-dependent transporter
MSNNITTTTTTINTTDPCTSSSIHLDGVSISELVLLFLLFQSMGVTIRFDQFKSEFTKPIGIGIALAIQFLFLPAIAYGVATTFVETPYRIGLVVMLCSPGGALSNMLAMVFAMDVPLSLAMTSTSSFVAMGMMPLNLYIYLSLTHLSGDTCISVIGIFLSAVIVVIGTLFGLALRTQITSMKILDFIMFIGGAAGIGILVIAVAFNAKGKNPIWSIPSNVFGLTVICSIIGMILGASLARLLNQSRTRGSTIAIECGVQNKILANAVIAVTFTNPDERDMAFGIPLVYGVFSSVLVIIFSIIAWRIGWTNMPRDSNVFIHGLYTLRQEMKRDKEEQLKKMLLGPSNNNNNSATTTTTISNDNIPAHHEDDTTVNSLGGIITKKNQVENNKMDEVTSVTSI